MGERAKMKRANDVTMRRALTAVSILGLLTSASWASGDSPASVSDMKARLAHDQAQVEVLDGRMSVVEKRAHAVDVAALFGPSDEEKAAATAAAQREQSQDSNIATLG